MTRRNPVVSILPNGVEHVERFAPFMAKRQLVPIVVNVPALRQVPAESFREYLVS